LISTPRGTKMFQFPRFPRRPYGFRPACGGITPRALPHSGIPGSTPAGGSPRLIAAYHALRRLLAPRHPPCALRSAAPAPARARHTPDLAQLFADCAVVKVPRSRPRPPGGPGLVVPSGGTTGLAPRPAAAPADQSSPSRSAVHLPRVPGDTKTGRAFPPAGTPPRGTRALGTRVLGSSAHARAHSLPTRGFRRSIGYYTRSRPASARGGAGKIRTFALPRARRALSH
jgi:hypothetical protein